MTRPLDGLRMPAIDLEKFRLAVARHAGDADDLAGAHGEGNIVDAHHALMVAQADDS